MSVPTQTSFNVETKASQPTPEASESHFSDGSSPTGSSSSHVSKVDTESLRGFTIRIWPETEFNETTGSFQLTGWGVNTRPNADQTRTDPTITESVHSVVSEEVARAMANIVEDRAFTKAVKEYTNAYRLRFGKPTVTTRAAGGEASASTSITRAMQYRTRRRQVYAERQLSLARTALVGGVVALLNKQVGRLETSLHESSVAVSDAAGSGPPNTYRLCFAM